MQSSNPSPPNKKNGDSWSHPTQVHAEPKSLLNNSSGRKEVKSISQSSDEGNSGRKSATPQRQIRYFLMIILLFRVNNLK